MPIKHFGHSFKMRIVLSGWFKFRSANYFLCNGCYCLLENGSAFLLKAHLSRLETCPVACVKNLTKYDCNPCCVIRNFYATTRIIAINAATIVSKSLES